MTDRVMIHSEYSGWSSQAAALSTLGVNHITLQQFLRMIYDANLLIIA